jgi:hypothetical protein
VETAQQEDGHGKLVAASTRLQRTTAHVVLLWCIVTYLLVELRQVGLCFLLNRHDGGRVYGLAGKYMDVVRRGGLRCRRVVRNACRCVFVRGAQPTSSPKPAGQGMTSHALSQASRTWPNRMFQRGDMNQRVAHDGIAVAMSCACFGIYYVHVRPGNPWEAWAR